MGASAVSISPGADLAPGLVERACRVLVAARAQVTEVHGESDEESWLLDAEVGAGEARLLFPGVGGLDKGFEHVQGGAPDAVAEEELLAAGETLQRRDEPKQKKEYQASSAGPVSRARSRTAPPGDISSPVLPLIGSSPGDGDLYFLVLCRLNGGTCPLHRVTMVSLSEWRGSDDDSEEGG